MSDEVKTKIRDFLANYVDEDELEDDTDIFASGFVNSLFAMQLVMFVEKEFGRRIAPRDLDVANFNSVNAIARTVETPAASAE